MTNHLVANNWETLKSQDIPSNISIGKYGEVVWTNTAPSGLGYLAIYNNLGKYVDIKNTQFCIEINGDNATNLTFIIRLSNAVGWAPSTKAVIIDRAIIPIKSKYHYFFIPYDIIKDAGYNDNEDVYFLIEQSTKTGNAVNLNVKFTCNAFPYSDIIAKHEDDFNDILTNVIGNEKLTWDYGQIRDLGRVLEPYAYDGWASILVPCTEGDTFSIRGSGGNSSRFWIFTDSEGTTITCANTNANTLTPLTITAPEGAVYLACNSRVNEIYTPSLFKGKIVKSNELAEKIPLSVIKYVQGRVQYPDDENTRYEIEQDDHGIISVQFYKTRGYAYVSQLIGAYDEIKNNTYTISLHNNETAVPVDFLMSAGVEWGSHHIEIFINRLIDSNETFTFTIKPSLYNDNAFTGSYIYFITRFQDSKNSNVNVNFEINTTQNATNSINAINAVNAINAGGYYLDDYVAPIVGITGTATEGTAKWTVDGNTHIFTIDGNVVASGQYWGRIAWDIKSLIGNNVVLIVDITNQNAIKQNWYFDEWHISKSYERWGNIDIKPFDPSTYGGDTASEHSKFYINIDEMLSDIDCSNIPNVYLLAAIFYNNPNKMPANVLSISVKVGTSNGIVIADDLKSFDGSGYYTKAQINNMIGNLAYNNDLLFWGDSLTAGAGGNGTTYPAVCASELGKNYKNCGVGGETANTISARQGANNLIIPAGSVNGTYTLDQMNDMFGGKLAPLRQGNGSNSGNKLYIKGQECTLTITQSSGTSTDATYSISGYAGDPITVPTLARFAGSDFTGKVVSIFVGQNGSTFSGLTGVDARIAIIDSMIKHIGHSRYVVLGLSSGTEATRETEDATMLTHYGNKFFPTRKLLVDYGLTIVGITPTDQDNTDISNGTVPTSLRSDGVHMNSYGYTAIGKLLADKIRSLGYFD